MSRLEIIKEGRHAGKHMKTFTDSVLSFASYMVTEPEEEKRAEAFMEFEKWLKKHFPMMGK